MRNRECMHHILILNTWGSWKPNIHCYKPSAVETMTLLQTLGRRIQQHCCKPSAVEPRHCYGFSAMIPFCGTFPKDSKSTALGLLGIYIHTTSTPIPCVFPEFREYLWCREVSVFPKIVAEAFIYQVVSARHPY